jgi:hypothetical protein
MIDMNKTTYDTRLLSVLRKLRNDLVHNRISEKEFEILAGLIIEKEFENSIQYRINQMVPKPKKKHRRVSFFNYEWKHSDGK